MYLFFVSNFGGYLLKFHPEDRWYLLSDLDDHGVARIFIWIAGNEYPLFCSDEIVAQHPEISGREVAVYYRDVVRAVSDQIQRNAAFIDLAAIQDELMPLFLEKYTAGNI